MPLFYRMVVVVVCGLWFAVFGVVGVVVVVVAVAVVVIVVG